MKYAPLIAWFLFIIASAYFDYRKIKRGKYIDHKKRFIVRLAACIALIIAFHLWQSAPLWIAYVLFSAFSFSLIFNLSLNAMRSLPLSHLGTDSILDSFEASLGKYVGVFWKVIATGFFLACYLVSW